MRVGQLGVDIEAVVRSRRVLARTCVDWTHRRPHLAGALPAAITERLIDLGWLARGAGRGLKLCPDYQQRLDTWLPPSDDTEASPTR